MNGSNASYQIIADLLAKETGQHLAEGRRWRVGSALAGVYREYGITNVDQLVCLLDDPRHKKLSRQTVEALLNNETYFFRDRPTFEQLPNLVLPELAARRQKERRIAIWCAGCSTGQEVYSIAMSLLDNQNEWDGWSIEILGTDVSGHAVSVARQGHYSQFEIQRGLGVIDMLNHFDETDTGWQIKQDARSFVRFEQHNLLNAPPARTPFDLILCRNALLYFDAETKKRAFDRLRSAMAHDGFLMLGAGETVLGQTKEFSPVNHTSSLYEASPCTRARAHVQHDGLRS